MQVAILGPLELQDGDVRVDVAGSRLRRLLIRLALDAGRPVSAGVLADAVWGDDPPSDAANALQSLVSRLRRALGDSHLVRQAPTGYRLAVDRDDVDAHRFERLAFDGAAALRASDPERAAVTLREALRLWRGPALADPVDDGAEFAAVPAARLDGLRLTATTDRIEADVALGRPREVVAELDALVREHPLDERLAGLQIRALRDTGRQADALAAYERVRRQLADELGVDPSGALQQIHLATLRGEQAAQREPRLRRTNLRAQLTSFVGRDEELARITKLLDESRLVTLVGPGGGGKTRLACEAAGALVDNVPDGIWLVELAPLTDPAEVAHAVLAAVGRRDSALVGDRRAPRPPREALPQLLETLAAERALLVVDNCEHLLDAVAELVDTLLAQCPQLTVLATSREPLAITGEALVVLPPLATPSGDVRAEQAMRSSAVRLFADRAADARPGFSVDQTTARDVVEIVRRLDGLPLAIELAAARLRTLPLGEIAARLSDRFRLLTGGSRTALPRHRTLRAVVEWSWDLLTPAERLLAERLAVFPAGATPASAAAVCAGGVVEAPDVPDLLAALADKSLLRLDDLAVELGPRYRMLETIREFGTDRMAERGELGELRVAHARYFAALVAEAEPKLRGSEQIRWLKLIDAEHDNALSALRTLCDVGDAAAAAQVALDLGWYWMMTDRHAEAATWLGLVLDVPGQLDPTIELAARGVHAMNSVATIMYAGAMDDPRADMRSLAGQLRDIDHSAHPMLAMLAPMLLFFGGDERGSVEAINPVVADPDPWVRAMALGMRARLAENGGDVDQMRADAEAAYRGFREIDDEWGQASVLPILAGLRTYAGDLDGALETLDEARRILAQFGKTDLDDQLFVALSTADVLFRKGDVAGARAACARARQIADTSGAVEMRALGLAFGASLERLCGDLPTARQLHRAADEALSAADSHAFVLGHGMAILAATGAMLDLADGQLDAAGDRLRAGYPTARETRDMPIVSYVAVATAAVAAARGNATDAARLLGAAARLRGADDPTSPDVQRLSTQARAAIGDAAFQAAWNAGWQLTTAEALDAADPARLDA